MTSKELHQLFLNSTGICTDTRTLEAGQLFFALKGANFNGNQYAQAALAQGASYAVVDEAEYANEKCILVDNVLHALQDLAKEHREFLGIPIIAITGSNGKTTTKELLHVVMNKKYNTYATKGNLNNHIGVPLSLLSITKEHEMAIIEMGANHQKEIEHYCQWALPNYGLINNIGKAHLEGFGGIEGVIKGKTELYVAIEQHSGIIFYNADDAILSEKSTMVSKRISFAEQNVADYKYAILDKEYVAVHYKDTEINSHLVGHYNGLNMGAALAVGLHFGVALTAIKEALANYIPSNNRSEWRTLGNNKILLDAYNANPTSMKAALESFDKLSFTNKFVLLGDMFEVGKDSLAEHKAIIDLCSSLSFEQCVFIGKDFYANKNTDFIFFQTTEEAKGWFAAQNFNNAHILIKGSRGMRLESLLN